jgi:hypothetical protein
VTSRPGAAAAATIVVACRALLYNQSLCHGVCVVVVVVVVCV